MPFYDIDYSKEIGKGAFKTAYEVMETELRGETGILIEDDDTHKVAIVIDLLRREGENDEIIHNTFGIIRKELKNHRLFYRLGFAPKIYKIILMHKDLRRYEYTLDEFAEESRYPRMNSIIIYEQRCGESAIKQLDDGSITIERYIEMIKGMCDLILSKNYLFLDLKPENTCILNGNYVPIDYDSTFIYWFKEITPNMREYLKTYMTIQLLCTTITDPILSVEKTKALIEYLQANHDTVLSIEQVRDAIFKLRDEFCFLNPPNPLYSVANPIKMLYYYVVKADFSIPCEMMSIKFLYERVLHRLFGYIVSNKK